jgi:hypothetical protein
MSWSFCRTTFSLPFTWLRAVQCGSARLLETDRSYIPTDGILGELGRVFYSRGAQPEGRQNEQE